MGKLLNIVMQKYARLSVGVYRIVIPNLTTL